jgi:hypothetical protein
MTNSTPAKITATNRSNSIGGSSEDSGAKFEPPQMHSARDLLGRGAPHSTSSSTIGSSTGQSAHSMAKFTVSSPNASPSSDLKRSTSTDMSKKKKALQSNKATNSGEV